MKSTLILLKPDTVQRQLIGDVLRRFEDEGFHIQQLKTIEATDDLLDQHYQEHVEKSWYQGLKAYMQEDRIVACILERENAVEQASELIGDTEPASSEPGTIRGDLGDDSYEQADAEGRGLRNLVHAAEDRDAAERELDLWFPAASA